MPFSPEIDSDGKGEEDSSPQSLRIWSILLELVPFQLFYAKNGEARQSDSSWQDTCRRLVPFQLFGQKNIS
jgi:hypothetical protein